MSSLELDITEPGRPEVQEVSPGVYAYLQPDGTWWINNTGFLTGPQGVISIDSCSTRRRTQAYLDAISSVTTAPVRGATTIVPGHGPVFESSEPIDDTLEYLRFIERTAAGGSAAGLSPLEAARRADLGRFAHWPDAERIAGNLHRAYAELAGAQRGAPIDIVAALTDMVAYNGGVPLTCLA